MQAAIESDSGHWTEQNCRYNLTAIVRRIEYLAKVFRYPDQIAFDRSWIGMCAPDPNPPKQPQSAIDNLREDAKQAADAANFAKQLPDHPLSRKTLATLSRLGDVLATAIGSAEFSLRQGSAEAAILICENVFATAYDKFGDQLESLAGELAASIDFGFSDAEPPLSAEDACNKFCFEQWQSGRTYKEIFLSLKQYPEWKERFSGSLAIRGAIKAWAAKNGLTPRKGARGRRPRSN
jgi:hypothetical protein